jgi:hypothetical protein
VSVNGCDFSTIGIAPTSKDTARNHAGLRVRVAFGQFRRREYWHLVDERVSRTPSIRHHAFDNARLCFVNESNDIYDELRHLLSWCCQRKQTKPSNV